MKTKKSFLKQIIFPFMMIMLAIFLCSSVNAAEDTTKVVLKKDGQNVKVSISPKEGASIASFQIGLKIEANKATDIKNVTFSWANIGNVKLKKESYDKEKGILNLYVVTEAEQNTGSEINVGTIKVETNKSTKVTVSPITDKTTASSIAHKDTKVEAKATDKVTYTTTTSGGNTGDNNQGGSTNKPGGSQGGNNSGSGSTGNGSGSNGSNSGSDVNDDDDEDKDDDKEDDEDKDKDNDENNINDNNEIDNSIDNNSSSNQEDSIATGTLPQTGEKDNFMVIWIFVALGLLVGVLIIYGYRVANKKRSFKL